MKLHDIREKETWKSIIMCLELDMKKQKEKCTKSDKIASDLIILIFQKFQISNQASQKDTISRESKGKKSQCETLCHKEGILEKKDSLKWNTEEMQVIRFRGRSRASEFWL